MNPWLKSPKQTGGPLGRPMLHGESTSGAGRRPRDSQREDWGPKVQQVAHRPSLSAHHYSLSFFSLFLSESEMFCSFLPPCCCWPTTQLEPSVHSLLLSSFGFGHLKDAVDPSKVGNGGYTYTGAWMAWPHGGTDVKQRRFVLFIYHGHRSRRLIKQVGHLPK